MDPAANPGMQAVGGVAAPTAARPAASAPVKRSLGTMLWAAAAFFWALYYFVIFSFGRFTGNDQKIIWSFGPIVLGITVIAMIVSLSPLPVEGVLLLGLGLWSLTGIGGVADWQSFFMNLKLIVEMAVVVGSLAIAIRRTGSINWFYVAFVAAGLFNVAVGIDPGSYARLTDPTSTERQSGLNANPNSLGFFCFMGVLGALALLGGVRNWLLRIVFAGCGGVCIYGILISASRGAFVALLLSLVLWFLMCFLDRSKHKFKMLLLIPVLLLAGYFLVQLVLSGTYLGNRLEQGARMDDGSSRARFDLVLIGLRLAVAHPLGGCGLGQFPIASGTGYYAHNELVELLGTTGFVGLFLYYSVYAILWARLSRSLRFLQDVADRYHVNCVRMALLVVMACGFLFRPNFLCQETMFLIGLVSGVSLWARDRARTAKETLSMSLPAQEPARIGGFSVQSVTE
jgi:O-antigen ligase